MTPYGQKTNTRPAEDPKARPWKPGGDRSGSAGLPAAALPSSGGCSGVPGPRQNQEPSKENNPRGRKCCKKDPVSRSSYSVMLASHWERRGRACVRRPGERPSCGRSHGPGARPSRGLHCPWLPAGEGTRLRDSQEECTGESGTAATARYTHVCTHTCTDVVRKGACASDLRCK